MPAGTMRRTINHRRSRRKNLESTAPQPVTPVVVTSIAIAGAVMTLGFDQPVSLSGTPGFSVDVEGASPISAVQTGPTTVVITFNIPVESANTVDVGFRDPAIRSASGGYVTSTKYTM